MKTQHTPGPWTVVCSGGGMPEAVYRQPKQIITADYRHVVATIAGPTGGPGVWLANSVLIAAAPAMAALAHRVRRAFETGYTIESLWHEYGDAICAAARHHTGDAGPGDDVTLLALFGKPGTPRRAVAS